MIRRARAAALAAFAAIALAACGGSSRDGETVDDPPAAAAGSATAFHGDAAHAGAAASAAIVFTSAAPAWSRTLPGTVSYAVVSASQAYVVSRQDAATSMIRLHAIDIGTGADVRAAITLPSTSGANLAASDTQVVAATFEGIVAAYDSRTGGMLWSTRLPDSFGFTSAPILDGKRVYVQNGSVSQTVALDADSGRLVWSTPSAPGGTLAPPTLADGLLYISSPCHVDALRANTGSRVWSKAGPCSGGGNTAVVAANGRVYVRDEALPDGTLAPNIVVREAAAGAELGRYAAVGFRTLPAPALTATAAYVLDAQSLRRLDLLLGSEQWRFAGDGRLVAAPLAIDRYVITASVDRVFAVDAGSGSPLWSAALPQPLQDVNEGGFVLLDGLAFARGHLLVPAGSTLTAWKLATP